MDFQTKLNAVILSHYEACDRDNCYPEDIIDFLVEEADEMDDEDVRM